jgi:Fe(3+) dicitrate transport protein
MKSFVIISWATIMCFYAGDCSAQQIQPTDSIHYTIKEKTLDSVLIYAKLHPLHDLYMPDIKGTTIYAGKKTNSISLTENTLGIKLNNARVIFAKIPGLTIFEMDGAGTQLNIGTRGTDPHRSIEMNMRQNGYNTNSDVFGYPENHYTVPMQAVEEVQLVRGSASLQFGPQFGGMMNFRLKKGDSTKPFSLESEQTAGSYKLFNSYNAIGGTVGKLNYYAFYDNRHGDGWRKNSAFNYNAYYVHLGYQLTARASITAEFSRMDYRQQIAGGLTDQQFKNDARQSERARNFFQPVINIPALIFKYDFSANTHFELTTHGVFGQRNSVQFINAGNIADTINASTGNYNPRQVDRDSYKGFTTEARLLHQYHIGKVTSTLATGLRYFNELTIRRQKGVGTTEADFDLSVAQPYGINLNLTTKNYALFAENIFQFSTRFSVTPGIRYENIQTNLSGLINNASNAIAYRSNRSFPLFGTGLQYQVNKTTQLYSNFSQAYRPYLYANVTPADRLDKIDPALKDSKGYDIDLGYRGSFKNVLQFDINAYYLYYGNKIGLIAQTDINGNPFLLTTNAGNSATKGVEAFAELSLLKLVAPNLKQLAVKLFSSVALNNAQYISGNINQSGINKKIKGKFVENAPTWVYKNGLELVNKNWSFNFQYSYTSKTYNDAFNTYASNNGVIGLIPAYHVFDFNFNWQFSRQSHVSGGINNFTNYKFFNRRITFYPGPGILPADGRTFSISIGTKI